MEKEKTGDKLKAAYLEILRRNRELSESVDETFKKAFETSEFDTPTVSASLYLIERLSRMLREDVDNGIENVIFSRDQISENLPLLKEIQPELHLVPQEVESTPLIEQGVLEGAQQILEHQEKPKTFGELLVLRLNKALPDEKKFFTNEEIESFAPGLRGVKKVINLKEGTSFDREGTIAILKQILTTSGKELKHTGSFDRKAILKSFPAVRTNTLKEWSSEIGHGWSTTPEVSFDEAMQIRGLSMLQRLNLPAKTSLPTA